MKQDLILRYLDDEFGVHNSIEWIFFYFFWTKCYLEKEALDFEGTTCCLFDSYSIQINKILLSIFVDKKDYYLST